MSKWLWERLWKSLPYTFDMMFAGFFHEDLISPSVNETYIGELRSGNLESEHDFLLLWLW